MQLYLNEGHRDLTSPYGLGNVTKLYKNAIQRYNDALVKTASKNKFFKRLIFRSIIECENLITVRYDLNHKEFIVLLNFTYRKRVGLCINSYPIFHITTSYAMKQPRLIGERFPCKLKSMKPKLGSIRTINLY